MFETNGVSSNQSSSDALLTLGLTPEQEKQLEEDLAAINEAYAKYAGDPIKQDAALAATEQKYQMDYAIFTASPPLSKDQIATLQSDYEQTVKDFQISNPQELLAKIQVDQARFGVDLLTFTGHLTPTQVESLKEDLAQLEAASENPNQQERQSEMIVAQARLNLDTTLITHPSLTQAEVNQLESDFAKLVKDSHISNPDDREVALTVDNTLIEKDTLSSIYSLTPTEKSQLDAAYQKMVNDANTPGPERAMKVELDLEEFEVLKTKIDEAHNHSPQ